MEQPPKNNSLPESSPTTQPQKAKKKRTLPSPRELVGHYEKKGMETQEASLKVIADLQNALLKMMVSSPNGGRPSPRGARSSSESSKQLDVINSRLLQLEMKVDSKPGYAPSLAIGIASGAILRAASEIWTAVRRATTCSSGH